MRAQVGILAFLALLAMPAHAVRFFKAPAKVAPVQVQFVPAFLKSMSLAITQEEFYGGGLVTAMQNQVSAIQTLPDPNSVLKLLQNNIEDGKSMTVRAGELGKGILPQGRAAAILAANALSRPEQFQEVVNGLEELKPGLGVLISESIHNTKPIPGTSREVANVYGRFGKKIIPFIRNTIYTSSGELKRLFDGTKKLKL